MRSSFTSNDDVVQRFLANRTVFSISSVLFILMIKLIDRVTEREIELTRFLLHKVLGRRVISLSSNTKYIFFRKELIHCPYVPITVGRLVEIRSAWIPVFANILIPLVVMGFEEITHLLGTG